MENIQLTLVIQLNFIFVKTMTYSRKLNFYITNCLYYDLRDKYRKSWHHETSLNNYFTALYIIIIIRIIQFRLSGIRHKTEQEPVITSEVNMVKGLPSPCRVGGGGARSLDQPPVHLSIVIAADKIFAHFALRL